MVNAVYPAVPCVVVVPVVHAHVLPIESRVDVVIPAGPHCGLHGPRGVDEEAVAVAIVHDVLAAVLAIRDQSEVVSSGSGVVQDLLSSDAPTCVGLAVLVCLELVQRVTRLVVCVPL